MFKTLIMLAAMGQFPDLVDVSGQYLPAVPLQSAPPLRTQVSSYELSVNIPIVLSDTTFLIPGLGYHVDSVSFSNPPQGFTPLRAFHAIEVPLLFVQLLPKDWSLSLRLAPGIAGDLRAIDRDVFRFSAVALATHSFSDNFVLGGGGLVSFAFGSLLPLPAIYVDWHPIEDLQIEAFLPAFADVKYTLFERVELGLHVEISGNEYAVRDQRIRSQWPCSAAEDDPLTAVDEGRADLSECFDHLAYSVGTAGLTVGVRLFSTVWLKVLGGYSFFRRFDQYNVRHELITGGREDLPGAFMIRGNLTWRIPRS